MCMELMFVDERQRLWLKTQPKFHPTS
jgi:hypothetical protein